MSDDEYEFQYSDDEGGNFGDDDAPQEDDLNVAIQNKFYASKSDGDVHGLEEVMAMADSKPAEFSDWAFKALKNIVKIQGRAGKLDAMLTSYRRLLEKITRWAATSCAPEGVTCVCPPRADHDEAAEHGALEVADAAHDGRGERDQAGSTLTQSLHMYTVRISLPAQRLSDPQPRREGHQRYP
jgi:hypothetical protein